MKCKCGYTIDYDDGSTSSVGEIIKKSGFYPLFSGMGEIIWICPSCAEKCCKLAKEIYEIVPSDYIYLYQFTQIEEKTKEAIIE